MQMFLVPRSACDILDTWDSLGLRATASHDFVIADAFVPERRQFLMGTTRSDLPAPLWRGTIRSQLGGPAAVSLGIARAAINDLVAWARTSAPDGGQPMLADRASVQSRVAEAEALVRSSRAYLYQVLASMWATQCQGDAPSQEQLAERDLALLHAIRASARAVDLMYDSAGSVAVYRVNNLECYVRDVHTITQHIAGSLVKYEQLGRTFLGMDSRPPSDTLSRRIP
jgi:alkylation response protein AidB-like acyl-CoA dehydrogenase